ncbi:MAG TPA: radical SAM family heme chaperone HemW [Clostridia bacterium]|nr:radical SAM family heme chaperone HemW [Clostridia bacterium]
MTKPKERSNERIEAEVTYAARQKVTSLYIHVPFCDAKCHYCDFYSLASATSETVMAWFQGLRLELERLAGESSQHGLELAPLETVYFGGGTPSSISAGLIADLVGHSRSLFGLAPDCQITLEANPECIDSPDKAEALHIWRQAGVNRLSLGLQTSSDDLLRTLGRRHSAQAAAYAVQAAWEAGFRHLALDLMTGLPDQTMDHVAQSLDFIRGLPIDHLSAYALTLAEETPFYALKKRQPQRFPDDDLERDMTDLIKEVLTSRGFEHYEISNFAKPGAQSHHNRVYWLADSYLAAGPAAASYMAGVRRCNPPSLAAWLDQVKDLDQGPFGQLTIEEYVDEKAARLETMILGLRLLEGVSRQRFIDRHGLDFGLLFGAVLSNLEEGGRIIRDERGVRLSPQGLDFADAVARAFL